MEVIVMKSIMAVIILSAFMVKGVANGEVKLWDTGKHYTHKNPMWDALRDKANWKLVPYGKTDYKPKGDLMIENEFFYLFLFSNKDDAVSLMAKLGEDRVKPNEIYKVHQDERGLRNFGQGTMWVQILKLTPQEVVVKHAGEGRRHGFPQAIVTVYRVLSGRPWLEVRPVELVNQQGMHGKSRICAFVKLKGDDFILDAKREPFTTERNIHAPEGTIGIINFSRRFRTDYDFMWFMTFPEEAVKHPLTYLGFHADPFWEDGRSDRPSVGAQYAYLGNGGVFIGVLNSKDNWKREDVGRRLREGEVYETKFEAPYPGIWKMVARVERCAEKAPNMVSDPGAEGEARVELRGCRFPIGWGCYCGAGSAKWGVTTDEAHSGRASVFMTITGHDERPITNNALTLGTTAGYTGENAFDAEPGATYRFSFWLKGKGFKRRLNLFVQGWKAPVNSARSRQNIMTTLGSIMPTEQWKKYEGTFRLLPDTKKFALFIQAYGDSRAVPVGATIWVDDVYIGKVGAADIGRYIHQRVEVTDVGQAFRFKMPFDGFLDYIMVYLWDRSDETPETVWTPMDVYRETRM